MRSPSQAVCLLGGGSQKFMHQVGLRRKRFTEAWGLDVLSFLVQPVEALVGGLEPVLEHGAGAEPVDHLIRMFAGQPDIDSQFARNHNSGSLQDCHHVGKGGVVDCGAEHVPEGLPSDRIPHAHLRLLFITPLIVQQDAHLVTNKFRSPVSGVHQRILCDIKEGLQVFHVHGVEQRVVKQHWHMELTRPFSKAVDLFGASPAWDVAVKAASNHQVSGDCKREDDGRGRFADTCSPKQDESMASHGGEDKRDDLFQETLIQVVQDEWEEVLRISLGIAYGAVDARFADDVVGPAVNWRFTVSDVEQAP